MNKKSNLLFFAILLVISIVINTSSEGLLANAVDLASNGGNEVCVKNVAYNINDGCMLATVSFENDGFKTDILVLSATYSNNDKKTLLDCTLNQVSLQSADTDKCVTFNCGVAAENKNINLFVLEKSTLKPVTYVRSFEPQKIISLNAQKVYSDDSVYAAMLDKCAAVHMRSGVVFANRTKHRLDNLPYFENGEYMVPQEAIEILFSTEVAQSGTQISIGNDIFMTLNVKSIQVGNGIQTPILSSPVKKGEELYLPLDAIAKIGFSKKLYFDATSVNSGMIVISDNPFVKPTNSDMLQGLNDYLFYFRPTAQNVLEDYLKSKTYGIHPRIMLSPDKLAKLKNDITSNSVAQSFYSHLDMRARQIVREPPEVLQYEFSDGVRLIDVADTFEGYMLILGLAYQLKSDVTVKKSFADAAWRQIEAVAGFKDWNPNHHIDVGIMAVGFAIAYDWMYDAWTPRQKTIMENAVYNNCFYVASDGYTNTNSNMDGVVYKNNHNAICNAGISMTALAFMDIYPEIASSLVSDSVRCLENILTVLAHDGCSYEGPTYGAITADYIIRMFASLETSVSELYGLDNSDGLSSFAASFTYLKSDVGGYSFNDGGKDACNSSALFWMYQHYGIKGYKQMLAEYYKNSYNDNVAQCVLFYDTSNEGTESEVTLDKCYYNVGVATMRDSYNSGQVFAGIKAGDTVLDHSHLDEGSFIYDAMGVRWAYDFGKDDYSLPGYYDWRGGTRWNIFRLKAQSHNTVIINPDMYPEFVPGSRADILLFESGANGVKTVVDMNAVLADDTQSAKRGFLFTDNRKSLVVRDEITLDATSDVYWLMYTKATPSVNGNVVTLTDTDDSSKQVTLEFCSSVKGNIIVEAAVPMAGTPVVAGQNNNAAFKRIAYKVTTDKTLNITAKLTPVGVPSTNISKYDTSIDLWQLPN